MGNDKKKIKKKSKKYYIRIGMKNILNSYRNFLEKKLEKSDSFYEIILESLVKFKDNFRLILLEMGNEPIARAILNLDNKEVANIRNNMFGSTNKNDTIDFVPDRKYQDLLKMQGNVYHTGKEGAFASGNFSKYPDAEKVWKDLKLELPSKEFLPIKLPINTRGFIVNDLRSKNLKTKKTYAIFQPFDRSLPPVPANIRHLIKDENYVNNELSKSVQEIKVGRGMKALLVAAGINKTDKEIEDFVNKFKSTYDMMNNAFRYMDIVEGEDIRKWYNTRNYDSGNGTLGQSCMKDEHKSLYFDIYVQNPEKCKLAILKNKTGDKIKGRALIWKLDDGKTFMDRIYTNNDNDVNLFKEFAKKNGWICKYHQGQGNVGLIEPSGKTIPDYIMSVTIIKKSYSYYPYMDTFKIYFNTIGVLSNNADYDKKKPCFNLSSTDGSRHILRSCNYCGGNGKIFCKKCMGNEKIECPDCHGYGNSPCKTCTVPLNQVAMKLKKGMWVITDGYVSGVHPPYKGVICRVSKADGVFYVAQNELGSLSERAKEFGFRRISAIELNNTKAWIHISDFPLVDEIKYDEPRTISSIPKEEFVIGRYVKTNGDRLNKMGDTVEGQIVSIEGNTFWVDHNSSLDRTAGKLRKDILRKMGYKYDWDIFFNNNVATLQFGELIKENDREICNDCGGSSVKPCTTCEGIGKIICPECKGTGGTKCTHCS